MSKDENSGDVVLLASAPRCPGCAEPVEHTGDKLFYCPACCNFLIEIEGVLEHYLLNPPETARCRHLIAAATAA